MDKNLLRDRIEKRGALILDGALATELEAAGCDLNHALWSARVLIDEPQRIAAVHRSYLEAGCDIIVSASYQASLRGYIAEGLTYEEAERLFRLSIQLAVKERDEYAQRQSITTDAMPLVAVSLGPFGAYLADGSEYRGNYPATPEEIRGFHVERLNIVAEELRAGHADLVAFETIPSLAEAKMLAEQLDAYELPGWISLSCKDETSTSEGQDLIECSKELDPHPWLVGLGVNCTAPHLLPALLGRMRNHTSKALLAYPNSGEEYLAESRRWTGTNVLDDVERGAALWHQAGATVLGGCCRTTPQNMASLVAWRNANATRPMDS